MKSSRIAEHFGHQLVRHRRLAFLSQDQLALVTSVHRTEISALERGLRVPRLDTILKMADGVKASPCDLIAGLRWRPASEAIVGGGYGNGPKGGGDRGSR